jgi:hypothetical protein
MKWRNICIEIIGFLLLLVLIIILIGFAITNLDWKLALIIALFSGMVGCILIPFGFWGADFAFGVIVGHIDQSMEKGKIKGIKNRVYVPFLRNYTPLEWWNINWFITIVGTVLSILAAFVFGYALGKIF